MKHLLIFIFVITLASCSDRKITKNNDQQVKNKIDDLLNFKNEISKDLAACAPVNWSVWEEYSEEHKTYLAHIGKGIFDLHFKADYKLEDTLLRVNANGKEGAYYHPRIVLHFYKNEKSIKKSVKFTQENPEVISSLKFAEYFGKTVEYIAYECSIEKQHFQPEDVNIIEFRKCLIDKITIYNKK